MRCSTSLRLHRISEPKPKIELQVGDCQNYGPFLGPYYNTGPNTGPNLGDPKRDHNFDNPPGSFLGLWVQSLRFKVEGLGFKVEGLGLKV